MHVRFQGKKYQLIITDHARSRMELRNIDEEAVIDLLQTGQIKEKPMKGKFWVFKQIGKNNEKSVCLSVSVETPNLIVITALVNWRPEL